MSTTVRKARKKTQRALRQATELTGNPKYAQLARELTPKKKPKEPTPVILRAFVQQPVIRTKGDLFPQDTVSRGPFARVYGFPSARSANRIARYIANRGTKRGNLPREAQR